MMRQISGRRLRVILPLLVLFLAAILRLHLLGHQSLWSDEGNSLRLAQRPIADLIAAAAQDIHPPGYYLLLRGWLLLTGDSEFALRALSALIGVLTVACVYALGKRLFAPGVGLIAAFLVALSSFEVYYGQEARMYAALALWTAAGLLFFVRWLSRPNSRDGLALALINVAGLYTHYTYPIVMIAQGIAFVFALILAMAQRWSPLANWPRRVLAYFALNGLTLLFFAPLLPTAIRQVSNWPRTGHAVDVANGLATVARWLIYGNTSRATEWWLYVWPLLFIMAALLPDWMRRRAPFTWRIALPLIVLATTILPLFALGLFRDANLKFLLPAQIAMALLIGRSIWLLWELGTPNLFIPLEAAPRVLAGFGLFSLVMLSNDALDNLYNVPGYARDDYRGMARLIGSDPRPGDRIVLDAPNQLEVFSYYYHGSDPIAALPAGLGGDDPATQSAIDGVIHEARRVFVLYWGENERDPGRIVENTLNTRTFPVWSNWYGNVRLALYAIPATPVTAPTQTLAARFGDSIRLDGVALSGNTFHAGDVLGVTLFWRTDVSLSQRYKVFLHLLDKSGRLVAQRDAEPGNNTALTTSWTPGQTVIDSQGVLIPPDQLAGTYDLTVGLYDIDHPTERVPVGGTDHVDLGAITITLPG